jgi:peptidoglycan L-alanyl-D-glutamate endopeptidase CwlK
MYKLGARSLEILQGVHPDLVAVVNLAIQKTESDFTVHDGLRTREEQARMVASGASKTMNSRHLTGHAVDLVPYLNGKLRWEWPLIYPIAEAMRTAGKELGIPLRWGGCWDLILTDTTDPAEKLVAEYVERKKAQLIAKGKKPVVFIDGPHFELPEAFYP